MALRELKQAGFSDSNIPRLMGLARIVEVIGGLALAMGVFPELGSLALAVFLSAATVIGHAFWRAPIEQSRMHQLVSFIQISAFLVGWSSSPPAHNSRHLFPFTGRSHDVEFANEYLLGGEKWLREIAF
jgi:hypothetical protein